MSGVEFWEQQRIKVWWIWLAVVVPAVVMASIFVEQIVHGRPHGEHPGPDWLVWLLSIFLCVLVPALLLVLELTITVDDAGVHIRYFPFVRRVIPFSEIRACRAREYRPIREFGGWGIRTGLGKKSAYNASGNLGVELYLHDGRSIMLGSRRPEELAAALRTHGVMEQVIIAPQ